MAKQETQIKLELYRYCDIVAGKCTFLHEDLVGTGVIIENTRYQIVSVDEPRILVEDNEKTKLYVHGTNEYGNDNTFLQKFEDEDLAQEFITNITNLVNRLNGVASTSANFVKVVFGW